MSGSVLSSHSLPCTGGRALRGAVAAALALLAAMVALPFDEAGAVTVRSWDDANQRGGDLFNSLSGFGYEPLEDALLLRGHVVLPGLAELGADELALVDVFFWGTSEHVLSATEQTVLADFVAAGGLVILETDSVAAEQAAANSAYAALALGAIDPTESGVVSADQGAFAALVTSTTVGPLGDLRGQTWAGSPSPGVPGGGAIAGARARTSGSSTRSVRAASSAWPTRSDSARSRAIPAPSTIQTTSTPT